MPTTSERIKSFFHFSVLFLFAMSIGFYFWFYIKPKIVFAGCSEVAANATIAKKRQELVIDADTTYEEVLQDCLTSAENKD